MVEKGYWRVKRPWKIVNQYEPSRLDYNPQHWTCSLFRCFRDSQLNFYAEIVGPGHFYVSVYHCGSPALPDSFYHFSSRSYIIFKADVTLFIYLDCKQNSDRLQDRKDAGHQRKKIPHRINKPFVNKSAKKIKESFVSYYTRRCENLYLTLRFNLKFK